MGETNWRWRSAIEMGLPLRWGGSVMAMRARQLMYARRARRETMIIALKMIGASGMRDKILIDVGDSFVSSEGKGNTIKDGEACISPERNEVNILERPLEKIDGTVETSIPSTWIVLLPTESKALAIISLFPGNAVRFHTFVKGVKSIAVELVRLNSPFENK